MDRRARRRCLALGAATGLGLLPALPLLRAQPAPALRLYTEDYPPITFAAGGRATGLVTEVVEEILQRLRMQAPIEVVPWARGYLYVTTLPNVGLFAATRTPEREPLFKWVGPVGATTGQLYRRRDGLPLQSLQQAREAPRILVPREWYLHQILRTEGFTNLEPVARPADALRMLAAGRGNYVALDDITVAASSAEAGVSIGEIVPAGVVITVAVQYIAFSRGTPDELVQRWQRTLDAMRDDGSYERIHRRWLPASPLPPR